MLGATSQSRRCAHPLARPIHPGFGARNCSGGPIRVWAPAPDWASPGARACPRPLWHPAASTSPAGLVGNPWVTPVHSAGQATGLPRCCGGAGAQPARPRVPAHRHLPLPTRYEERASSRCRSAGPPARRAGGVRSRLARRGGGGRPPGRSRRCDVEATGGQHRADDRRARCGRRQSGPALRIRGARRRLDGGAPASRRAPRGAATVGALNGSFGRGGDRLAGLLTPPRPFFFGEVRAGSPPRRDRPGWPRWHATSPRAGTAARATA